MAERSETRETQPRRSRRRWIIIGAVVVGLVVAVGVVLPRFAAGWLAQEQLERMGIANQGVTSLAIDLWRSRIDLGAVEFWGADSERGRIDEVSMTYAVANLFAGHALVDRLRIKGIDIQVQRDAEGRITVNGVELTELLGPEEDDAVETGGEEPAEAGGGGPAFGVGLDGFLLEESRAFLETETGGTLTLEIERLVIEDMRSWDPDHPAVINLVARVNDIELRAEAQAHLFTETIMVDAHVRLDAIDLDKVTRFTGPFGFERRDGEIDVDLATSMQIEPDGRVVIAGYGDIVHEGARLVRPDLDYRVGRHRIDVSAAVAATPMPTAGEERAPIVLKAAGDVRVRSDDVEVKGPGAAALTYEAAEVHLAGLSAVRDPDGRIRLEVAPTLEVTAPATSDPIGFNTERVAVTMPALGVTVEGDVISLRTTGATEADQIQVSLPGADDDPPQTVGAGSLRLDLEDLAASLAPGRSEIAGRLGLVVEDVVADAKLPTGAAQATTRGVRVELGDVRLLASGDSLDAAVDGALQVDGVAASLPGSAAGSPTSIELNNARAEVDELSVAAADGAAEVSGRAQLDLGNLAAETAVGEGSAAIALEALEVALTALEVVAAEHGLQLTVTGNGEVGGARVQLSDGPNLELGQLASDLDGLEVALDPTGNVEASGTAALSVTDAVAGVPLADGAAEATVAEAGLALTDLQLALSGDGGGSVETSGATEIVAFRALLPAAQGRAPATLGLADLGVTIERLAGEFGGPLQWAVASSIEGRDIEAALEGDGAASILLPSLALEGLEVDHALSVNARRVELTGLEVDFSDRTIQAMAGAPEGESAAEEEAGGPSSDATAAGRAGSNDAGPAVRIDEVVVGSPAVVRYTDTAVESPVDLETALTVEITNLDTANPDQRTELAVDATINQGADLDLAGWATAGNPPDFDLDLELRRLELAPLSPYAAEAVGMDIESGVFDTTSVAAASGGALEGNIDLVVEDLVLIPTNEEAAQAASAAIGVPIGAVVGLLEDEEGRIELGLPIGGTIDEPQVDPSEAISAALAGTLESVFPPTAIAGMLMSEGGIEFRPIVFAAGSDQLSDEGRDVIDGFVALLNEKPRLDVLPCGRATSADAGRPTSEGRAATETSEASGDASGAARPTGPDASDALLGLAEARASAVQVYLVEEKGIAVERVRACRPRYDPDDDGPPRVDLTLT